MEKSVRKGAIYGFFISLALAILFVKYKIKTPFPGGYSSEYVPVYDYVISLLRYSVVGALAGGVVGWIIGSKQNGGDLK